MKTKLKFLSLVILTDLMAMLALLALYGHVFNNFPKIWA